MKTTLPALVSRAATLLLALSLNGLVAGSTSVSAASASELLEKAIYSEETKGDLDGAMKLYKQVVAENQGGQALAAQAQYHLGLCLYKKKNYAAASTAFEKVVADYPTQSEWVARARRYLASSAVLAPASWAEGEDLRLSLKLATGMKIGFCDYTMDSGELSGQKVWRLGCWLYAAGTKQFSRVEVDAESMKPLHSVWRHSLLGEAETSYAGEKAVVQVAGQAEPKTVPLEDGVYDNEEVAMAIRRMPLAVGYKNPMRIFSSLGGCSIVPITLSVSNIERVDVPAGSFDCFRIELSLVKQTFWYSTNSQRYLVKFQANGVVAELSNISQRPAGSPVSFQGGGFSLTAPANWFFYSSGDSPSKEPMEVILLDPDTKSLSRLAVQPRDNLSAEAQKSVRAWAEQMAAKQKNLKLRADGFSERTVGGAPAVSCVGDYTEAQTDKVAYGVWSFIGGKAVEFSLTVPAKDFEDLRPQFDSIVNSYKAQ